MILKTFKNFDSMKVLRKCRPQCFEALKWNVVEYARAYIKISYTAVCGQPGFSRLCENIAPTQIFEERKKAFVKVRRILLVEMGFSV